MSSSAKRLVVLVAIVLVLAGLLMVKSRAARQTEVHLPVFSQVTYDQARANTEADGKYLLVYATASWCPPCQEMKKETWPDARVMDWVTRHGSAVLVDVDENEDAAMSLHIEAMPTMVLFKGNKELGRVTGRMSAVELLAWLDQTAG